MRHAHYGAGAADCGRYSMPRFAFLSGPVTPQCRLRDINLMAKRGTYCITVTAMARFADKLHLDKQKIDGVESAVLLSIIVGGLALCVLGAAIYDMGRAFSAW
jgi:hypothetical protein